MISDRLCVWKFFVLYLCWDLVCRFWTILQFHDFLCRTRRRWIDICLQPWCNPLWLTGLKAPTNNSPPPHPHPQTHNTHSPFLFLRTTGNILSLYVPPFVQNSTILLQWPSAFFGSWPSVVPMKSCSRQWRLLSVTMSSGGKTVLNPWLFAEGSGSLFGSPVAYFEPGRLKERIGIQVRETKMNQLKQCV